jgi:uncharacterized membrane protein
MEIEPPKPGKKKKEHQDDEEVDQSEIALSTLAYVPVLCLVSVIHPKREDFVLFHTRQGLCLFLLELVSGALFFVPLIGPVLSLTLALACMAIAILAIRTVRRRGRWAIPFLSTISEHINI